MHSGGFDPRSLQDIISLMGRHDIPVPPTLTLLARALVTLEGTLRVLDPKVDLATAAAGHFGASMEMTPTTAQDAFQRELLRSLPALRALPGLTEDVALQLRSGRVRLQVDAFSGAGSGEPDPLAGPGDVCRRRRHRTGRVVPDARSGVALARPEQEVGGLLAVGYIGLVISSVMLMRVVAQILRREGDSPG